MPGPEKNFLGLDGTQAGGAQAGGTQAGGAQVGGASSVAGAVLGRFSGGETPPRFTVLSVPYDRTATYVKGASKGPAAIIEASAQVELYDEELETEPWKHGVETLPPLDVGDLTPEAMVEAVEGAVGEVVSISSSGDSTPVLLGGEHSVTIGAVRALKKRYPELSVLQLDAHADLRDSYQGSRFNHACVGRRIIELCPLVQAGVRSLSAREAEFLSGRGHGQDHGKGRSQNSVKTFFAKDLLSGPEDKGRFNKAVEDIAASLSGEVYITIDIDCLDPSVMPATGTPEPGGLSWYEVLGILRAATKGRKGKKVVGFDLVELSPIEGMVAPDFLASRLVYRLMGYITRKAGL